MKCPACNKTIKDGSKFCTYCGSDVEQVLVQQFTRKMEPYEKQARDNGGPAPDSDAAMPSRAEDAAAYARDSARYTQGAAAYDQDAALYGQDAAAYARDDARYAQAAAAFDQGDAGYPQGDAYPQAEQDAYVDAEAQLRDAKAQYKAARKAAGKSAAPKVLGAILGAILIAGAAGGGVWYFTHQDQGAAPDSTAQQAPAENQGAGDGQEAVKASSPAAQSTEEDSSEASTGAANSAGSESSAASAESKNESEGSNSRSESSEASKENSEEEETDAYVGVWRGSLTGTSTNPACYAAQETPIQLYIKSIDSVGKMKIDVKVLYHGHSRSELSGDVESHDGDTVQEWKDLTSTLSDESFKMVVEEPDIHEAQNLEISGRFSDEFATGRKLEVSVKSGTGSGGFFTDEFTLEREEDK